MTNEKTNICGIYELPLKIISVESGIDHIELERSMFPKLEEKIVYYEGWVIVKNFQKHQNIDSPSIIKAIQKQVTTIPKKVLEYAISVGYEHRVDRVSTPWGQREGEVEGEVEDKIKELHTSETSSDKKNNYEWLMTIWNKYTKVPQNIYGFKNTTANSKMLPQCRKWTDQLEKAAKKVSKQLTNEEMEESIKKYVVDILDRNPENSFASHRFSILEFLTRERGIINFYNK